VPVKLESGELPNGPRLSCGAPAVGALRQLSYDKMKQASEQPQFLLTGEAPSASSAC